MKDEPSEEDEPTEEDAELAWDLVRALIKTRDDLAMRAWAGEELLWCEEASKYTIAEDQEEQEDDAGSKVEDRP